MTALKNWLGVTALGAAIASLFNRIRHRNDDPVSPKQAEPLETSR